MLDKPSLKRYAITVQHEVIVYSYSETTAKETVLRAYASKPKCIGIKELPPVEVEAMGYTIVDNRNAPGQ
jgi:hypothetical protein